MDRCEMIERQFRKITGTALLKKQAIEVSGNKQLWNATDLFSAKKEGNEEAVQFFQQDLEQRLMKVEMEISNLKKDRKERVKTHVTEGTENTPKG